MGQKGTKSPYTLELENILRDNPNESYASIANRIGTQRQWVTYVATRMGNLPRKGSFRCVECGETITTGAYSNSNYPHKRYGLCRSCFTKSIEPKKRAIWIPFTCDECGKSFCLRLSEIRSRMKAGHVPSTCCLRCKGLRRTRLFQENYIRDNQNNPKTLNKE